MSKEEVQPHAQNGRNGFDSVKLYRKYQPEAGTTEVRMDDGLTPVEMFATEVLVNYPPLDANTQKALLGRLKSDTGRARSEALDVLYLSMLPMVAREVLAYSTDGVDPADVLQEVCMVLKRKIELYDETRGTFNGFIYSILHNLILDKKRNKTLAIPREYRDGSSLYPLSISSFTENGHEIVDNQAIQPEEAVIGEESNLELTKVIEALPLHYRSVMILLYGIQCSENPSGIEYSYEEIAKILSIPLGTVKSRFVRAKRQLKRNLLKESDE